MTLPTDAAPFLHFDIHRPADHITRGQVLGSGRVALHEALSCMVEQHSAFSAHTFSDQNAHFINPGRVELKKLHVFSWNSSSQGNRYSISGVGVSVRGDIPDSSVPPCGKDH